MIFKLCLHLVLFCFSNIAVIWICDSKVCFMGQQPDPKHPKLGLRWVLPYTKDTLCDCTKILLGGVNLIPVKGSENFFYTDTPLMLVNSINSSELQKQLGCKTTDIKSKQFKVYKDKNNNHLMHFNFFQ